MDHCTTKCCTKCNQHKPLSEFRKQASSKDGYAWHCKACRSAYDQRYAAKRGPRTEYHRSYRATHAEDIKQYQHSYKMDTREKIAAYNKTYKHNHQALLKDYHRHYNRQYLQSHLVAHRAKAHLRRARKLAAGGTHNATDIRRQGELQKWRCWWCGENCKEKYHVDHLVPLSRGGHNGPGNIVIACPRCNLSKKDKLPDEFMGQLL